MIKRFEFGGVKARKGDTSMISFEGDMEFVDRHGRGVEWAWVRTGNVRKFTA